MATTKQRLTVTLSDKTHRLLKAISELSDQPMSVFINEMLESAAPTLERMAATFQAIKSSRDSHRQNFLKDIDAAQAALEPAVMETLDQFDLFLGRVEQAASDCGRRDVGGAGARLTKSEAAEPAPPTNRGATNENTTPAKPIRRKALKPVLKKTVQKKPADANSIKPRGCTCTYTAYERMEKKDCPVHQRARVTR